MKHFIAWIVGAFALVAAEAAAQPVTYYVYSIPYSSVGNATACSVGSCSATYSLSHKLVGYFTIAGAPLANQTDYDISVGIGQFSLNDGQNTYSHTDRDVTVFINTAKVDTNASREITNFEFKFDRVHTAGSFPVGNPADPAARVSSIWFSSAGPTRVLIESNAICQVRGDNAENAPNPTGGTFGAGCLMASGGTADGASGASATEVTVSLTPPPPPPVPTLSEWAMILLGVLLGSAALLHLQRRRTA